ncbi:MAG: cytochrome o ubiquinol oxidase subunit IV [Bauldia sp.]|uniref:cytochrome o ubiquinol oxidase subunit IV n=1 Tax=Bauldia sp. TaxID=2575872 RepID=UPI001DCBD4C2|nr:cytochrome o ubiquinol oxidase subunit IV [Bauldia sp.]MCB1495240.1 cytochrome o ubiquinol oxidase subunit IV [Bauldia sp.]
MQDAASHQGPDLRAYLTGFVLAVILTAIPFGLVYFKALPIGPTVAVIVVAAVIQVLVHLRFFLHIGLKTTPGENLLVLLFAVLLLVIMVGGSVWIMFDLHYRMML